jgi:hypothetical protein
MSNKFNIPNSGFGAILKSLVPTSNQSTSQSIGDLINQKRQEIEKEKMKNGWFKNAYGQWEKSKNIA